MNSRNPLDAEMLAELFALQADTHPTLVKELVELFLSSAKVSLTRMDAALQARDMKTLSGLAHGMKSSAANLAALDLSKLCLTLENMDELPSPTAETAKLVQAIKVEFEIVQQALQEQIASNAA